MSTMRMISPNGHLGFAPLKPESFRIGVAANPDIIAADPGSDDVGPGPLGSDTSTSPLAWQRQDLEAMLLASRQNKVPMIIGSAGDRTIGRSLPRLRYERAPRSRCATTPASFSHECPSERIHKAGSKRSWARYPGTMSR